MIRSIIITIILISFGINTKAQYTISGFVRETSINEIIIGAHVFDTISKKGFVTDNKGWFSIKFQKEAVLKISFVGYHTKFISISSCKDSLLIVELEQGEMLNTFEIVEQRTDIVNVSSLSTKEILAIPNITGTPDVIKAMSTLPGIQIQSEGSSLLMVRGGSPGQNLYLLDNAPLIHVNHLGGFLSVFNPEMINHIDIYKGSFPVEYGGKMSSIVNITQKEGSASHWKGTYSLGITDISLSLEGPINDKSNLIFTGRKTLLFDLLLSASSKLSDGGNYILRYGFHDLNAKVSWSLNKKNKMYFNIYQGDDYLSIKSKMDNDELQKVVVKNKWGNYLTSLSYNSVLSSNLFIENSLSFTHYRLLDEQKETEIKKDSTIFQNVFKSSVDQIFFSSIWHFTPFSNWQIKFGLNSSYIFYIPYSYNGNSLIFKQGKSSLSNWTNALFLNNKFAIRKKWNLDLGGRLISYVINDYAKFYFEPRTQLNFKISKEMSINASFMHVIQTSHLLYTSAGIVSNEVWIPATMNIPPILSNQASLGISVNVPKNKYSIEISTYFKSMQHLSTFKEGVLDIKENMNWENLVETNGIGKAYGIEFNLRKNFGVLTTQLSYDYSYSDRRFSKINHGKTYVYDYNRPHNISFLMGRKLNHKWSFSLLWVYQSGTPYTPAIGRQMSVSTDPNENGEIYYFETLIYGERNSARMRAYHRLDIAFQYTTATKKRKMKAVWTFGVYNVYNRKNPTIYYYNNNASNEIYKPDFSGEFKALNLYQLSLFPIIPNLSYKVYFNGSDFKKPNKQTLKSWLFFE